MTAIGLPTMVPPECSIDLLYKVSALDGFCELWRLLV
jgi:hypothetical protein